MKLPIPFEKLEELGFSVKPSTIGGIACNLVIPKISMDGSLWNDDTLIFRSSIWSDEGELVSASFSKFFNLTEAADVVRDPTEKDFKECKIIEKIDGSTLIVSLWKGNLIHRTRGTFNAELLPNGSEISVLKQKYPMAFDNFWLDHGVSLLFEWTTPSNKIIIDYGDEPELRLIGAINHEDYTLVKQSILDDIGLQIGVPRPKVYNFDTMDELVDSVQAFDPDREGVVVYFNNEQDIKKVKGIAYLKLHRFKANATLKNITEIFFDKGFNTAEEYREYIKNTFDYECFMIVEAYITKIWTYYLKAVALINELRVEVAPLVELSRKDAALKILSAHKADGLSGYCFTLLDKSEISVDNIKKLLYNLMESGGEIE